MDNICHTLVGAALGEAGLKRRTRYGNATLMIAANLPDVDVFVFLTNTPAIAFRRGWTHGILAQLLLPVALTAAVALFDLLRGRRRGRAGGHASPDTRTPISIRWLLLLSYVGVYSHVALDYLNNYGVRLLAPFDWRWFYGDALFIVDPWLWLSLGAGAWLSSRRRTLLPARGALVFATCYIAVMLLSARAARATVLDVWQQTRRETVRGLMVGPRPVTPLTKDVIVDAGDHYEIGEFSWPSATVTFDPQRVPKNAGTPAVRRAAEAPAIRSFITWSRFPFWVTMPADNGTRVSVGDMRFAGFGPLRIAGQAARFTATTTVPVTPGE